MRISRVKGLVLCCTALILFAAAAGWLLTGQSADKTEEDGAPSVLTSLQTPSTAEPLSFDEGVNSGTAGRSSESGLLPIGYAWNPVDPGIASSAEDARWLELHGYPDPESERYLNSLNMDRLEQLARAGNKQAAGVLAYRMAREGAPREEVVNLLLDSAAAGSMFALKTAGDIFSVLPEFHDPAVGHAFNSLLARSGDQSGFSANYMLDGNLNRDQRLRASIITERMSRKITERRGGRPLRIKNRPGFNDFLTSVGIPLDDPGRK